MLTFTSGNMFDTPADIRINTVNCVGVMGAGLALAFKTKYPDMFREYQKACKSGEVKPGKLHVWNKLFGDCIINFPTKRHWREPSRYEDIEAGLIALKKYLADKGKVRVLLPAVGCGHGGLEWNRISAMIKKELANIESEIIVFTPADSRAAGDKIKDHNDIQVQDKLDAEGIKTVEPGDDLFPSVLRGRSAAKLYIKGDIKKLNSPLLTILPSTKPTQKEIDATTTIIESIMHPGITLLVGYSATIERPAIKRALEKSAEVVVILAEGILGFRVRKDLLDVWDDNRIVVISATKPLEQWSPSNAFRVKDLQLSLASIAIITDAEPQSISKMLLQKASQKLPQIYYADYGNKDENIINTFKKIRAQNLTVNDLSNPLNYKAILNILESHETTQPIDEIHKEAIRVATTEHHVTNEAKEKSINGSEVQATGSTGYPKRLIEVDFPIKKISEHSRREKSIRHGHISTLHIWWSRKPLAASRAAICATLWPDPADPLCPKEFCNQASNIITEFAKKAAIKRNLTDHCSPDIWRKWNKLSRPENKFEPTNKTHLKMLRDALLDFIADFANWDNSTVEEYLETSRALTQSAHQAMGGANGTSPLVVDPFAGGGSIPLEALRVGADAFASDLNPIAVLLNKVMLEYIPQYGSNLSKEVQKWGSWVENEAKKELNDIYPKDPDGSTPIAYLWARTIVCTGPKCGLVIPIFQSGHLVKLGKRKISVSVKALNNKAWIYEIKNDLLSSGTSKRGSVTCPCCGYTTPIDEVRRQLKNKNGGTEDASLMVVVLENKNNIGRSYRLATNHDIAAVKRAMNALRRYNNILPTTEVPFMSGVFNIPLYGMDKWHLIFTPRQRLFLITLVNIIKVLSEKPEMQNELGKAITTCLALVVDKCIDFHSSLTAWISVGEKIGHTFGRQALGMIWDYSEAVPFVNFSGSWSRCLGYVIEVIDSNLLLNTKIGTVIQCAAQDHVLPDDSANILVTDPPYYNAVPFADLSDFFYVWLSKMLSKTHPALFNDKTSPKDKEIAELNCWDNNRYAHKDKMYFHKQFYEAMLRARAITTPDGLAVVFFAHKTTSGWEATLGGLIDAGWIITASWPLDTERAGRLRAMNSAVLASSILLICRPRENPDGSVRMDDIGDWRDVLSELPKRIHEWMPRLAEEGVVGADAIFACIGPALEIFSRYSSVEKASGERVILKEYLEQIWAVVAKEALNMIFEGADTSGFEEDARLTAMWLWTLSTGSANGDTSGSDDEEDEDDDKEKTPKAKLSGYALEYDAARKIAQGLGANLEHLQNLVEVKGDKARLLSVTERTKSLFGKNESESPASNRKKKSSQLELGFMDEVLKAEQEGSWGQKNVPHLGNTVLDRIHQSMILFAANRGEALKRFLVEEGVGRDQKFWKLAQALSALYPSISDEKRWVDGVLARKKGLGF